MDSDEEKYQEEIESDESHSQESKSTLKGWGQIDDIAVKSRGWTVFILEGAAASPSIARLGLQT